MKYSIAFTPLLILRLAGCSMIQPIQTVPAATPFMATQTPGLTPIPTSTDTQFVATETPGLMPGPTSTVALQLQPDPVAPEGVIPTSTEPPTSASSEQVREMDLIDRAAAEPETYQTDFAYLTSPQYLEDLRARDARGETPGLPTTAIYIEPYDPAEFAWAEKTMILMHYDDHSLRLQEQGFDTIFHITQGIYYMNRDSRPFVLDDLRMTEINGTPALFYTMKWENRDGTFGYESHVWIPRPGEALREEAIFATSLEDNSLLVNGMFFVDHAHCMQTLSFWGANPEGVCDWYMNQDEEGKRIEIYTNWQETGKLTNTLSDGSTYLPISPGVLSEIQ